MTSQCHDFCAEIAFGAPSPAFLQGRFMGSARIRPSARTRLFFVGSHEALFKVV
jgi:hypothetical protein